MARKISEEIKHEAVKLIEEHGLTQKKIPLPKVPAFPHFLFALK